VAIIDIETGAEVRPRLTHHTQDVLAAAFSPTKPWIVSSGEDADTLRGGVHIVNLITAEDVFPMLKHHTADVAAVAWSPDGTLIATGSRDHKVGIIDASTGEVIQLLTHHTGSVSALTFSPDSRHLLTGSDDSTAAIVDVATGKEVCARFDHHSPANQGFFSDGEIYGVAFSPDGRRIMTCSEDGSAVIIDLFWHVALPLLAKQTKDPPASDPTSPIPTFDDLVAVLSTPSKYGSPCCAHRLASPCGRTPMHHAAEHRNPLTIKALVNAGLPVHTMSSNTRQTVLHATARPTSDSATNEPDAHVIAETLAAAHKDQFKNYANLPDADGRTALALAVDHASEHPKLVDFLLAQKADPLITDDKMRTCLHLACVRGHVHCATSLITSFANVDAQDEKGRTPLLISAIQGSVPLVFLMLQHGARHDISDDHGWLPLSYSLMPLTGGGSRGSTGGEGAGGGEGPVEDEDGNFSFKLNAIIMTDALREKNEAIKAEDFADLSSTYDSDVIKAAIVVAADTRTYDLDCGFKSNTGTYDSGGRHHSDAGIAATIGAASGNGTGNGNDKDDGKDNGDGDGDGDGDGGDLAVENNPAAALEAAIAKARARSASARPDGDRYNTIAMALLKKENHLDVAIEDDIGLFTESLERHFHLSRADLVRAFYDPADGYDNDMYRDPLLQRAIDLDWTSKVFPSAVWELVQFSFFLCVVCLLGAVEAGQLSPTPHYLDQVFDTIFIGENWDDYGVKEFGDIGNAGELWPWIENVFLGGLYPDPEVWRDANGDIQTIPVATNQFVGRPRMRTLESAPEPCAFNKTTGSIVQCFNDDLTTPPPWLCDGRVCPEQVPGTGGSANTTAVIDATPYGFQWEAPGSQAVNVGMINGVFRSYPDGGLVVTMPEISDEATALVAKLKAGDWINLNTRAFIAEFTAFNAKKGVYTAAYIMVEMSHDGLYRGTYKFRNFPKVSYSFSSTIDVCRLVLEVIFLVYLLLYTVDECKQAGERWEDPVEEDAPHWKPQKFTHCKAGDKQAEKLEETRQALEKDIREYKPTLGRILVGGLSFKSERAQAIVDVIKRCGDRIVVLPYFYEAFNYFDICLIICFTLAIILQVAQLVQEATALPQNCAGGAFVPGSFVIAQTHTTRMYLWAIGAFFCWCKMFEYLRIRESFATMFFIIWGMMAKLGSFVIILMVVLLAFTSLDFMAFGSSRERSRSFTSSLVSRFQGSLGDVDFESAEALDQGWGLTFLIFFIVVAVLLLLNLLIAVMSEAYEEVKETAEARWAYIQMEMLVEYDAEQASKENSKGGCGGCCGRSSLTNEQRKQQTRHGASGTGKGGGGVHVSVTGRRQSRAQNRPHDGADGSRRGILSQTWSSTELREGGESESRGRGVQLTNLAAGKNGGGGTTQKKPGATGGGREGRGGKSGRGESVDNETKGLDAEERNTAKPTIAKVPSSVKGGTSTRSHSHGASDVATAASVGDIGGTVFVGVRFFTLIYIVYRSFISVI
jgi:hypothetical protein